MKTTWNPHTKKPSVSSQNPRCRAASPIAWPTVCRRPVPDMAGALFHQRGRKRHHHRTERRHHEQRRHPAQIADQRLADRHHHELPERTGGTGDAECGAALLGAHRPPDHAIHDAEGRARQPEADEEPGAAHEREPRGGRRHQHEAKHVEHCACDEHSARPVAIRNESGERLRCTPGEILEGDGKRKHFATPTEVGAHRLQKKPERVADAHRQRDDGATAEDHNAGRAPVLVQCLHRSPACIRGLRTLIVRATVTNEQAPGKRKRAAPRPAVNKVC